MEKIADGWGSEKKKLHPCGMPKNGKDVKIWCNSSVIIY